MTRFLLCSVNAYRAILLLYPEDLRRDFGPEMLDAFEQDLSAGCAAGNITGALRVWRITLLETIRIGLPAWLRIPAVAVPLLSAAAAVVSQSPLLIVTIRRQTSADLRPGDATAFDALLALAIGAAITALTSFIAVHPWKRASHISLGLH
jgi:hypothetical protein